MPTAAATLPSRAAVPAADTWDLAAPALAAHRLTLERLLRYKPHTLTASEERLLAMQLEMAQAAPQAFGQLTNADMTFGDIEIEPGRRIPLTHASFLSCLESRDR